MAAAENARRGARRKRQRQLLGSMLHKRRALVIVDMQRDFCEGGSLAVPRGDDTIEVTNALRTRFNWDLVVLTQDWHPPDHVSFSSNNPGTSVFQTVELPDIGSQVMWPDHCVQGSEGATFHPRLDRRTVTLTLQAGDAVGAGPDPDGADAGDVVVRKGTVRAVDSYSGFGDASGGSKERTPLADLLRSRGIGVLVVVGLAQDFCVSFTCRDGRRLGFDVVLVEDGTRGITPAGVESEMRLCDDAGVVRVTSDDVPTASLEAELRAEMGLPAWKRFAEPPAGHECSTNGTSTSTSGGGSAAVSSSSSSSSSSAPTGKAVATATTDE